MRVKGFYRLEETNEGGRQITKDLCFICAVAAAANRTLHSDSIGFMTTEYEFMECERCGRFITDEVELCTLL